MLEAFDYTLDNSREFYIIIQDGDLDKLTPESYKKIVLSLSKVKTSDFEKLVDDATKIWFNKFKKSPIDIPFCFNEKGDVKLRINIAKELGYSHGEKIAGATVGNGSVKLGKSIKTADQEQATCFLWNRFVECNGELDLDNIQDIQATIKDMGGIELTEDWVRSCAYQINTIKSYLDEQGFNYLEYKAGRFGDPKFTYAKKHEEFVKKYVSLCKDFKVGSQKDTFDPSDIIIANTKHEAAWSQMMAGKTYQELHKAYVEIFEKGWIIGISLKKITADPSFSLFNIGEGKNKVTVKSVGDPKFTTGRGSKEKTGIKLVASGTFKFSETSAPDDPEEPIEETKMNIACRSFSGGHDLDIDITATTGPALGKVPRDAWRNLLGVDNKYTQDNLDIISDKLNNKNTIQKLIEAGVKNGPWCLPFVLVH